MAEEDESSCLLCDVDLNDGRPTRMLAQSAINNCMNASGKRKDKKHLILKKYSSLRVHEFCAKNYTNEREINKFLRDKQLDKVNEDGPSANTRQTGAPSEFNFDELCIVCSGDASDDYIQAQKKREKDKRDVVVFANESSKQKFLDKLPDASNPDILRFLVRIKSVPDLVEVRARFHRKCQQGLYRDISRKSSSATSGSSRLQAANFIAKYIVENKHLSCQFSLKEILENYQGDEVPHVRYLKERLNEIFGEDIIIHPYKKDHIITFADVGKKLLTDQWYSRKLSNDKDERLRLVDTASKIILQDIKSQVYDTKSYPAPDQFQNNLESDIPETLKKFITNIITERKSKPENFETKIISICHAIISLVRPRSYLSSLQVGLAAMLMKQYGSRELIQILNALGFCSSYEETQLLQSSILNHDQLFEYTNAYVQFVFNNADHNVNTIDGKNTFHSMGGIEIVTPASAVNASKSMERVNKISSSQVIGNFGKIHVKHFHKGANAGFENIFVKDLNEWKSISYNVQINSTDFFWLCAKNRYGNDFDGWNGFMQKMYKDRPFEKSRIIFLPFINAPPSNHDTIYTALLEADKRRKQNNQEHTFITFDQPLYYKAREISECCKNEFEGVVIRLGGFHLLMSFMGSIGFIMEGSGLRELFCQIYAENSVDKILKGHAYARAVRGHLLIHSALTNLLISSFDLPDSEVDKINGFLTEDNVSEVIATDEFQEILTKFRAHIENQKNKGPTSKLWLQYYDMVTLIRQFIEAERSANWDLHLDTIRKMLPYFYSSGHYLYAKSAQLYLQDMYKLEEIMDPLEFDKFTRQGYFAIRRTDKFWCGVWSDMTIEQMLMRSMKTRGGLTHGRGVTDAVLAKWVLTMPALTDISDFIQSFCNVSFVTSEQHVDSRTTRLSRDAEDLEKLMNFFETYEPFVVSEKIHSITSGIQGDITINCHLSYERGLQLMQDVVGTSFKHLKFQRKNRVLSLRVINSVKTKDNESIVINPTLIFQRISVAMESLKDLKMFLSYELAPFPLSLFDNHVMRKTEKSKLYVYFKELEDIPSGTFRHIIDGGHLLHKIVWPKSETFNYILDRYVEYVKKHYSADSVIVFDGYPKDLRQSTKNAERIRREAGHLCADIDFDLNMTPTIAQTSFLSNSTNKVRFINKLRDKLGAAGFTTKQALEDADYLIVKTAVDLSTDDNMSVIVAEDIDILIIMTQIQTANKNIFLLKPSKNSVAQKMFDKESCILSDRLKPFIGFIHAFSGCDSTSSMFSFGKPRAVNAFKKNEQLIKETSAFYIPNATPPLIEEVGLKIFCYLYGGKKGADLSLNELRYRCFKNNCRKSNFNLASLPPTEAAARLHSRRVYCQLQRWLGHDIDANSWGWVLKNGMLLPKYTSDSLVPDDLLRIISCKCVKECTATCGCFKHGLKCSEYCGHCHGETCKNHAEVIENYDLQEDNDSIDEIVDMIEQQLEPDVDIEECEEKESDSDSDDEIPRKRSRFN